MAEGPTDVGRNQEPGARRAVAHTAIGRRGTDAPHSSGTSPPKEQWQPGGRVRDSGHTGRVIVLDAGAGLEDRWSL